MRATKPLLFLVVVLLTLDLGVVIRNRLQSDNSTPPVGAEATLWVDAATGDDSLTRAQVRAGGGSLKWASLCRATNGASSCASGSTNSREAAAAGDIVIVAPGKYSAAGTGLRMLSPFNPANSGTSANPIVFQCATNRACTLGLSSSEGPTFGCRSRSYIRWDGFVVHGADSPSTSDTGHVDVYGATGCEILNSTIQGDLKHPDTNQGNYNAIRIEDADGTIVRGNELYDIAEEGEQGGNQAIIMMYDSNDTLIESNTLHNGGNGIYVKGIHDVPGNSQSGTIIRYNLLYDMPGQCLDFLGSTGATVYQNICRGKGGGGIGITFFGFPASGNIPSVPRNVDAYNNVFDGFANCVAIEGAGGVLYHADVRFWNNLCLNGSVAISTGSLPAPGDFEAEHNFYYGYRSQSNFSGSQTLRQWKALSPGRDSAAPASVSSDPLVVDRAKRDYHLRPGSPALNFGRTFAGATVHAGAYLTGSETIGRE